MKKQVAVIGLGRFGVALATTLHSLGHDVLALDVDEKNVQAVASKITSAVQADATSEATLRELGIGNFDIAIVAIGTDIEKSVLSTILLKKLGVRYLIARAENELHGSILEKIGVNRVIYPEREMGTMVAHVLTLGEVMDYIPVAPEYGVVKLTAPDYFVGETLSGLSFGARGKWKVAVLLIVRKQEVIITPNDSEVVKAGDALVVAGNWDNLDELFTEVQKTQTGR
ncbi:MAG: TrkA family potassium uptake protein [Chloroflexi bacterium]|nr:TrkA family potassium uptake protein [Chloroflexota bacterium]